MTIQQPPKKLIEKKEQQRTLLQNRSLHLYFTLLAKELNDKGLDMRKVLKPTVEIPWEKLTIKKYLWKPIQYSMKLKKSTTELTTKEIDEVYDVLNRHLAKPEIAVHIPFPSIQQTKAYLKSLLKNYNG